MGGGGYGKEFSEPIRKTFVYLTEDERMIVDQSAASERCKSSR